MKKILAVMFVILAASYHLACTKSATPTITGNPSVPATSSQWTAIYTGANGPRGLAVDGNGNVYVANTYANNVVKVAPGGSTTTLVSGVTRARGVAVDQSGTVYYFHGSSGRIYSYNGSSTLLLNTGYTRHCAGIVVKNGTVYFTSIRNGSLASMTTAGANFQSIATGLYDPHGLAVADSGTIYWSQRNGLIMKMANGVQSTFASGLSNPWGLALDSQGNLYVTETGNGNLDMFTPTGTKTVLKHFGAPYGVAVSSRGQLYVADGNNNTVYAGPLLWP